MDRAAAFLPKRAKPSPGARRLARQLFNIGPPRAIFFEKTPENTLKATYVEVPLKPGQLSGPENIFSVLFKGGEEETASIDAAAGDEDDDGEEAAAAESDDGDEDDDGDEAAAAEGDEAAAAEGDDGDEAAAEEGDDDDKVAAA